MSALSRVAISYPVKERRESVAVKVNLNSCYLTVEVPPLLLSLRYGIFWGIWYCHIGYVCNAATVFLKTPSPDKKKSQKLSGGTIVEDLHVGNGPMAKPGKMVRLSPWILDALLLNYKLRRL